MINKILSSFEGNIAVGKTTFEALIEKRIQTDPDFPDSDFVEEPVKIWSTIKNDKGEGLLDVFYKDKERYSYLFQSAAYITRMKDVVDHILRSKNKYLFTDRSLQCDKNVFAKMLYDGKLLNKIEWSAYNKWNDFFDDVFYGGKYNVVYLQCDPKVAYDRMKKRNRKAEEDVPLAYLTSLHNYHENWLINDVDKKKYNVLVLDCNKDFENDPRHFNKLYGQFKTYILSLKSYDFSEYFFREK